MYFSILVFFWHGDPDVRWGLHHREALVFMVAGLIVCCVSIVGAPFVMSSNFMTGLLQLGIGFLAAGFSILAGLFMVMVSRFFVRMTGGFSCWLKKHLFCRMKEVHLWKS